MKKYDTLNNTGFKAIRDWRPEEKPREKLLKHGADKLTDSELLAILIRNGTKGKSAIDIASELLDKFSSITKLSGIDLRELSSIKGLGDAKAISIAAAFEIGRRIEMSAYEQKYKVSAPQDIAKRFIPILREKKVECFYIILLNTAKRIIREVKVSEGLLDASLVHPREIFKIAIIESAACLILLHNHPSGSTIPSKEDMIITNEIVQAGKLLKIEVLDHLIIGGNQYSSFAEMGYI